MSAKPETTFIASVHAHLPAGRKDPYWMKNHNEYMGGVFDVWYSGDKADVWIEYKFIEIPKRADTLIVPNLSALQLEWGHARAQEGREVCVIVGCKEGGVLLVHEDQWEVSMSRDYFVSQLRTRKQLADFIKGCTT